MPPSPWLSARMMNIKYLTLTTIVRAQKISDATPSTVSGSARQIGGVQALAHRIQR